ncbi:Hint domain-containing protein [uncultured Methylobacterium sp.]|uniref:Hint domain-containing protein n=1 Tax=uncultured Methylobacterium sp. TaxID=157278 RepID=UPI0035CB6259
MGADAHDATGFANVASTFRSEGYTFVGQYIDQFSDANTAGSPSVTAAQVRQETSAGLQIMSIFQTNGMSSSTGAGYQTYFTASQGTHDATEAISSARTLAQPAGSAIYFAMDFDPAAYGAAGSERQLLTEVQTYLTSVSNAFQGTGYTIGVYGAGDTLAAAIRNSSTSSNYNASYTPVAQYGWLTQSYAWAGSNPQTDANAQGWSVYQSFQTTVNGVAIDPDTATTNNFGQWTVCFTSGTRIRTTRGEVAVEDLIVGDLAVTASGGCRPIRWIGHRTMEPRRHPRPEDAQPIRIRAHALGDNHPARDLLISPRHSIALDVLGEVLIPAAALINGSTIVQEDVDSVTYWHVELDSHDLLVAENQPAESYLDLGNRNFFGQGTVIDIDAVPDATEAAARTHADFCRPFHDGGALVEVVRAQSRLRAETLGWKRVEPDTWADVHLEVDGRIVRPKSRGLSACFVLSADARDVWLVCPTSVPCHVSDTLDARALGLCLSGLSLNDGLGEARPVALDDPLLCLGFHAMSPGHRWTAGRAWLPAALLEGLEGKVFLRLDLAGPMLPRWIAPAVKADLEAETTRRLGSLAA